MSRLVIPGRAARPAVVADVMTRDPATCSPDATLADAARSMWNRDCGFVPVTDEHGTLVGVVTDRDACMAAFTRDARLSDVRVRTAMSADVASVRADAPLSGAHETMRARQVRRLPVLDARGRLVGVISLNDLALHAERRAPEVPDVASTLGAVCAHRELATA